MASKPKKIFDWVALEDAESGRVFYVNAKENAVTYTIPRGTPARNVQKAVQKTSAEDEKAKRGKKQRLPQSFEPVRSTLKSPASHLTHTFPSGLPSVRS
jgi:hypothetical protein